MEHFQEILNRPHQRNHRIWLKDLRWLSERGKSPWQKSRRPWKPWRKERQLGATTSNQRLGRKEAWSWPRSSNSSWARCGMWKTSLKTGSWVSWLSFPRRGDLSLCKNYRGIMLLTIASKVLCRITLQRTKDALDDRLQDEQAGFYKGAILLRPNIVDQTLAWNTGLCMVFVDFEKAFYFVYRDTLWKVSGVPEKIVKIIQVFYKRLKARAPCTRETRQSLWHKDEGLSGVPTKPPSLRCGAGLVSRQVFADNKTGKLQKLEDLSYADDLVLLSQKITHTGQKLKAGFH